MNSTLWCKYVPKPPLQNKTKPSNIFVTTEREMSILAASSEAPPLYEKQPRHNNVKRAIELVILFLLFSLLIYRFVSLKNHDSTWLVALCCESWFTFIWIVVVCTKWSPALFETYPQRLMQQVKELPPVDMFVTTADPELEPPILTVNTVLSLLAVEYPGATHRLTCYVSDDACSAVTFYALSEASKFAQRWVPFCKKYKVKVRAPFRYFTAEAEQPPPSPCGLDDRLEEFHREWQQIKTEYEELSRKIEDASKTPLPPCNLSGDFGAFSYVDRRDHPPIVQIIWENKERDPNGVPHLIYISREKRPKHHHRYKAGAMNVLMRVSGIMTNAPFMLNVDCDMYANNSEIVLHAMCVLVDSKSENDVGFVQCPQHFYDELKDDPFGNQLKGLYYIGMGVTGLQGALYGGTGCFHRRKVIYGSWPSTRGKLQLLDDESTDMVKLVKTFGTSEEFCTSAAYALKGQLSPPKDLATSLEAARQGAKSNYEYFTLWGKEVGLRYGSTTEDVLTGLGIHTKGWRSVFCTPDPPAFKGCAPTSVPVSMTQQKRWSTGLLEILVSKNNPVIAVLFGQLQLRQCMAYLWILLWGARSVPELIYALLPPYCLITNSNFLPPVHDRGGMLLIAAVSGVYTMYHISEYFSIGLSMRTWWNNQRMSRVTSACSWTFGVLGVVLKLLRVSDTVFEVTKKEQSLSSTEDADAGRFTFDESPLFVPGTALLLVQLASLMIAALGLQKKPPRGCGSGFGEVACALYLVLCFWPFLRGLVAKGKYGIPPATISKAAALTAVFMLFCRSTSRV